MKVIQLIKISAVVVALGTISLPTFADCAACDSANPDSNAETQQEPDQNTDTMEGTKPPYYTTNTSYSPALSDDANAD